ncbi:hypothetical protein BBP40_010398 [Aspergillus hancockii]|nr:hypothetical protein BBP40_010398 [Aspergillus hancockii]
MEAADLPSRISVIVQRLLLYLLLFPMLCGAEGSASGLLVRKNDSFEEGDLVSFLNSKTIQHDAMFTEAVLLLESMRSSPSCNRIAATRLVTSCQSIEGKTNNMDSETHIALEHTRSVYAARLAICELNGAGTSIPPACLPVTFPPPHKKGLFGFSSKRKLPVSTSDSIQAHMLESCLKTLESRPQWWTSYSNSRQNAFIICQAARVENEKEELLDLHRSVVDSSSKLNQALHEALRAAASVSFQHRAFVREVEAMNDRLAHDIERTQSRFKTVFEHAFYRIEARAISVANAIASVLGKVQDRATTLDKDLQNISAEANKLQYTFRDVLDGVLSRNGQIALAQQQDAMSHNELALSIRSTLQTLLQDDIAQLSQDIKTFDASIEWLSGRFGLLSERELNLSERLRKFEMSLKEVQVNAEDLHKVQLQQSETVKDQSRLQEKLQTSIRISQALLDKVSTTTANLQVMIDETTARYKDLPSLGLLFNTYFRWFVYGLFLCLIASHRAKVALAIFAISALTTKIL